MPLPILFKTIRQGLLPLSLFILSGLVACKKPTQPPPPTQPPAVKPKLGIVWSRAYGGTSNDFGLDLVADSAGNYFFAADAQSTDGDLSGNDSVRAWVVKLGPDGKTLWQRGIPDPKNEWRGKIASSSDGGVLAEGTTSIWYVDKPADTHAFFVKYDASGNTQWKTLSADSLYPTSSGLLETPNGFLSIQWTNAAFGSHSNTRLLDKSGTVTATQITSGSYLSLTALPGNEYLATGVSSWSPFISKIDAYGNELWRKTLDTARYDEFTAALATSDGNILLGGTVGFYHNAWLVKTDNSGNVIWNKNFGGSGYDEVASMVQTADGGFLIAANSNSQDGDVQPNNGINSIWLFKIDGNGNLLWQQVLGGSFDTSVSKIIKDKSGAYVLVGSTNSNDGDISGNHGQSDVWIAKVREQ